jgi:hypothetical protein
MGKDNRRYERGIVKGNIFAAVRVNAQRGH